MESIDRFNNLHGKKVSRADLIELMSLADNEGEPIVASRIQNLLNKYPDLKRFNISLNEKKRIKKKSSIKKMAAPRHQGVAKEALTECGRLRKGYRYIKGGKIVKAEHVRTKKKNLKKKPISKSIDKQYALFGKIPEFKTRKQAKTYCIQWAKKHLKGKSIYHEELKKKVVFSMKGIDHSISSNLTIPKALLIFQAESMLISSSLLKIEADKKGRSEIKAIYRMSAVATIDEKKVKVVLTLREGENGIIYYDHKFATNKKPSSRSKGLNSPSVCRRKKVSRKKQQYKTTKSKPNKKNKKIGTLVINTSSEPTPAVAKVEGLAMAVQLGEEVTVKNDDIKNLNHGEQIELPKKNKVIPEKKEGVLNSNDLMSMNFETIDLTGKWKDFMQEPAKIMKIGIIGRPKNGKTSGSTALANELTNHGSVLYNFVDQGFNKNTQKLWELSGLSQKKNAFACAFRDLNELEKLYASGDYDYVFIDMINNYIHQTGIKYFEFEERFIKQYPSVSPILVFESTKGGDFKGDQGWTHILDQLIYTEDFVMESTGRYGVGDYVVWEDGLRKNNPKKHKEMFGQKYEIPKTITL